MDMVLKLGFIMAPNKEVEWESSQPVSSLDPLPPP